MPSPCQRFEDEATELQKEIDDLTAALGEVPPSARPGIRREIARLARQLAAVNQQLSSCQIDPRPFLLQLEKLEVTQAIQDLDNSIPLVAGKATIVRAYLSYYGTSPITVRGSLQAQRPGLPAVPVASLAPVILDPTRAGNVSAMRNVAALSLNFALSGPQTDAGTVSFSLPSVTDTSTLTSIPVAFNVAATVRFIAGHPLRVRVLAMRYSQQARTFVPTANDLQHMQSWLRRAYPVADVIWSTAVVDANTAAPFGSGDINAQLAAIRALDMAAGNDKRTHYYGMVSDGGFFMRGSASGIPATPDPSTVASGPTGPGSYGWDFDGSYGDWYGGHELGHTFGRKHPGFCGESHDDPAYPYPAGQLAASDASFAGFDVGDPALGIPMTALPGTQWHDVMTYCNTQWLSDYTYGGIRARLAQEDELSPRQAARVEAMPAHAMASGGRPDQRFPDTVTEMVSGSGASSRLTSVVASVNMTQGHGKLEYVHPLPAGDASPVDPMSPVVIRARRADATFLRDYPVAVKLNSELGPLDERRGLVDVVLPLDQDAAVLELVIHGRTVDTLRAGAPMPSLMPASPLRVEHDAVVFSWGSANAAGPGNYRYTVQVSSDGGQTWQTVAVGLTQPTVRIDRAQFFPGQTVQVKIIGTDGFSSSELTTQHVNM
jgi:hypothetical protein